MAERYAPPSFLVSPDHKLAHLSENAGRYLVHPAGELTANVFKLVREELRIELQALLQRSREKREPVDSKPIPVRFNGHPRPVVIRVRPSTEAYRKDSYWLFSTNGDQIIPMQEEPTLLDNARLHRNPSELLNLKPSSPVRASA